MSEPPAGGGGGRKGTAAKAKAADGKAAGRKAGAAKAAKGKAKAAEAASPAAPMMDDAAVAAFYAALAAARPEPQGELDHVNPFTLLVAVVLSAQATDKGVNKATKTLFALADTPEKMAALGEDGIAGHIRTIGLWRNKAKNVAQLCRTLIEEHGGEVPRDRAALERLPGVGRKTANVVLNIAWGEPTIAVDTHVFRIANRTGLAPGATPLAVEKALEARTPAQFLRHAHHWLILHGRYVCKARRPDCAACPPGAAAACNAPDKTAV